MLATRMFPVRKDEGGKVWRAGGGLVGHPGYTTRISGILLLSWDTLDGSELLLWGIGARKSPSHHFHKARMFFGLDFLGLLCMYTFICVEHHHDYHRNLVLRSPYTKWALAFCCLQTVNEIVSYWLDLNVPRMNTGWRCEVVYSKIHACAVVRVSMNSTSMM